MAVTYKYKNLKIGGGGFVTGFVFHPLKKDVLYARTDIGGCYRFDFRNKSWISLIDNVTALKPELCYPLSLALDPDDADKLYIACGDARCGRLYISRDRGETFTEKDIPCPIHGNFPGRATGERLIYDRGIIYFASQTLGLFKSVDEGESWERISVCGEKNLTFINIVRIFGREIMFVGTNGEVNAPDNKTRGHSLYVSYDGGKSFSEVKEPEGVRDRRCTYSGFVAQRGAFDGRYFYVTFAQTQEVFHPGCYTCDTGKCFDGRVYRYDLDGGKISKADDVTPKNHRISDSSCPERFLECGMGGIDYKGGMLIASEISSGSDDTVFVSFDRGESWHEILKGLSCGKVNFTVNYMKPCYNGGKLLIHWMSDIKINPLDNDMAVFNTGTGVFATFNLTDCLKGKGVVWEPLCRGMEETVHLNVYSPPKGEVRCIDIVGDLGGFAYKDLDEEPENSFADENGDRYITCLNADFPDRDPMTVVASPRGNWTGRTKGGLIISHDQCGTWRHMGYPYGLTDEIDRLCEKIKKPNVDSGWAAITADGKRVLWAMASEHSFFTNTVVYTDDEGKTWRKSTFLGKRDYDKDPARIKIYSDRINPNVIMALNEDSLLFISVDKGKTFLECEPDRKFGGKAGFEKLRRREFEARVQPDREKTLWLSSGTGGIWRIVFDSDKQRAKCEKMTSDGDFTAGVGFGMPAPGASCPAIYTSGSINGTYGFFRSLDGGKSYELLSRDNQHYGTVISISGDMRKFGRFYIATGSRGLFYGEEDKQETV